MLDYSETSENVYLAFNQNIGLKNKRFQNLVHLTFKSTVHNNLPWKRAFFKRTLFKPEEFENAGFAF